MYTSIINVWRISLSGPGDLGADAAMRLDPLDRDVLTPRARACRELRKASKSIKNLIRGRGTSTGNGNEGTVRYPTGASAL